jgi:hypothetical protein
VSNLTVKDSLTNINFSTNDVVWANRATPDHNAVIFDAQTNIALDSTGSLIFAVGATFSHYATIRDKITDIPLSSNGSITNRTRFYNYIKPLSYIGLSPIQYGSCTSYIDASDPGSIGFNATSLSIATVTDRCDTSIKWIQTSLNKQPDFIDNCCIRIDNHAADERLDTNKKINIGEARDLSIFVVFSLTQSTSANNLGILKSATSGLNILNMTTDKELRTVGFTSSHTNNNVFAKLDNSNNYAYMTYDNTSNLLQLKLGDTISTWTDTWNPAAVTWATYEVETVNNPNITFGLRTLACFDKPFTQASADAFVYELKKKWGDA